MFACSLRAPGRPTRPQSTANALPQFCRVRPRRAPLAPLMRRSRRVVRFQSESHYSLSAYNSSLPAESATSPDELQPAARGGGELRDPKGRKSNAQSPANSSAQSTAQISAPCSARRGAKTVIGFRA